MAASVDGRIVVDAWPNAVAGAVRREYEAVHEQYDADGWICGRVTMEPFATRVRTDAELAADPAGSGARDDFVAGEFDSFAFAIDASGRLVWESSDVSGDHVVAVVSNRVSDAYLASLRSHGVSYVIAGERDVDLRTALEKIRARFDVRTLMLEGGGRINGGFLRAGLIDELSLLVVPVGDGRLETPTLFDVDRNDAAVSKLSLAGVERRGDDILWLRYDVSLR